MSDLISREEAIEEIESVWNSISGLHPHLDDTMALYADIKRIVKQLPSAYSKKGKWTRENNYGIWECSECGCRVNRVNPLKGNIWNYYYCPNCGARMDAERKEE